MSDEKAKNPLVNISFMSQFTDKSPFNNKSVTSKKIDYLNKIAA
jgi:hypothetical protein